MAGRGGGAATLLADPLYGRERAHGRVAVKQNVTCLLPLPVCCCRCSPLPGKTATALLIGVLVTKYGLDLDATLQSYGCRPQVRSPTRSDPSKLS